MPPVQGREPPILYCDPCHGIAPTVIGSPRDFFAAQAFVLVVAAVVLLLVV